MIAPLTATVLAAAPDEHAGDRQRREQRGGPRGRRCWPWPRCRSRSACTARSTPTRSPSTTAFRTAHGHLRGAARRSAAAVVADHPAAVLEEPAPRPSTGGPARTRLRSVGAHHETGCTMRNKAQTQSAATMVRLLENARYEVLPTASIEDTVLEHVDPDTTLTVTASPGKGLEATLDLTERLTSHGYTAVPHLAARMVRDRGRARGDLRPADRPGHRPDLRARRRRRPARRLPRRAVAAGGPHGDRQPVRRTSASPATPSRTRRSATT